ncbi:hypothetical protein CF326_g6003 [Tilletia indica]|nr:hypothetical protein CF326_g6003 [Tilletia indica]
MSAPASPRLRLKCRLHPCPAYRVLVLPDADEQQQLPTLTQVRDQAASAWQLSNADGLLLAILDADGDELALFEQEEWEGFLSSVVSSTSAASANPLLRLCLTQDPRLSRTQAAHPISSTSTTTPAPTPAKKSDIEIRNEALADSFTAMLHRARSTETPESRAREYASRFYAISKTEVVPAEMMAGGSGGAHNNGTASGAGTGTPSSATASSSSKKDQVEKKREDWKARADQLYGSLVAVPPRNSALPPASAPAPSISSEEAPAASPETITKQETDSTSQESSTDTRISQEKPDTDGVKTPNSPVVDQPESSPPKTGSKRPKRPVEEVNSELNSAWETMHSRMRG